MNAHSLDPDRKMQTFSLRLVPFIFSYLPPLIIHHLHPTINISFGKAVLPNRKGQALSLQVVPFYISLFTIHHSLFTINISHFTSHISHLTFHISHLTFHISHLTSPNITKHTLHNIQKTAAQFFLLRLP
mgnify:CR=1 FL=1